MVRRVSLLLALLAGLLTVWIPAASAHTVGGSGASNYLTKLTSFDAPAGVTLKVVENGNKLQLTNSTTTPLTVLGYSGEPYLLVTPQGVQENVDSSAVYLNVDRFGTGENVPDFADNKHVSWKPVSATPVAIWHDHRIHWMETSLPPQVAKDTSKAQTIFPWTVSFTYGDTKLAASGVLNWVPGPSPFPWALVALVSLLVVGAAGFVSPRLLGGGLVLLTAADVVHTLGVAADRAGTTTASAWGAYPAVDVVWVVALAAAALLLTGKRLRLGMFLTAATGAWMLLVGGFSDIATFHTTTAPFAWDEDLERALTAVELGAGVAVVVLAVRALVRSRTPRSDEDKWEDEPVPAAA